MSEVRVAYAFDRGRIVEASGCAHAVPLEGASDERFPWRSKPGSCAGGF
jgi:hypothetical protein